MVNRNLIFRAGIPPLRNSESNTSKYNTGRRCMAAKTLSKRFQHALTTTTALAASVALGSNAYALDAATDFTSGTNVSASTAGSTTTVTQSGGSKAIANWSNFDTSGSETVEFRQHTGDILLNRITSGSATTILGTLKNKTNGGFQQGSVWIV